jgi:hypothetical protein
MATTIIDPTSGLGMLLWVAGLSVMDKRVMATQGLPRTTGKKVRFLIGQIGRIGY